MFTYPSSRLIADATHHDYVCIDKSKCYTFTINDTWGDGLLGVAGYDVEVYDRGGVAVDVVTSGGDYGFIGECHIIYLGTFQFAHILILDSHAILVRLFRFI